MNTTFPLRASFHSGKLSVDWNGQEFFLSCELWVGANDFNTKKNFLARSNPRTDNFPEWKLAFSGITFGRVRPFLHTSHF
jgi:hypothetical protein